MPSLRLKFVALVIFLILTPKCSPMEGPMYGYYPPIRPARRSTTYPVTPDFYMNHPATIQSQIQPMIHLNAAQQQPRFLDPEMQQLHPDQDQNHTTFGNPPVQPNSQMNPVQMQTGFAKLESQSIQNNALSRHPNSLITGIQPVTQANINLGQTQAQVNLPAANDLSQMNFTFNELVQAMNGLTDHRDEIQDQSSRSAESVSYPPSSYGYPSQHSSHGQPTSLLPHLAAMKLALTDLAKPVTDKASSKVNGLMSLVLGLLGGSGSGSLVMKGFTDVILNGIIKPMLVAKGGLKVLISKLTIPFVSLLLINLEVLITVWWMWDDCPEPVKDYALPPPTAYPAPAYPVHPYQKPVYNNNNYKAYN